MSSTVTGDVVNTSTSSIKEGELPEIGGGRLLKHFAKNIFKKDEDKDGKKDILDIVKDVQEMPNSARAMTES